MKLYQYCNFPLLKKYHPVVLMNKKSHYLIWIRNPKCNEMSLTYMFSWYFRLHKVEKTRTFYSLILQWKESHEGSNKFPTITRHVPNTQLKQVFLEFLFTPIVKCYYEIIWNYHLPFYRSIQTRKKSFHKLNPNIYIKRLYRNIERMEKENMKCVWNVK